MAIKNLSSAANSLTKMLARKGIRVSSKQVLEFLQIIDAKQNNLHKITQNFSAKYAQFFEQNGSEILKLQLDGNSERSIKTALEIKHRNVPSSSTIRRFIELSRAQ